MTVADLHVHLAPIDEDNVKAVFELTVAAHQAEFVAPNPWSLAQAVAEQRIAWPRAMVAGEEVVGFLMLEIDPETCGVALSRPARSTTTRSWRGSASDRHARRILGR